MLRIVFTVLEIASLLFLLFIYSRMQIASREDEREEHYIDADWTSADEDL